MLVLGGTGFVGRTVVTLAISHGWKVTTFTRGHASWAHPAARQLRGDRLSPADLATLDGEWDTVLDTWAGAPKAVTHSATALTDRAERYVYVSSRAVYAPPLPRDLDESHPTVKASAKAETGEYAPNKRGGELAALAAFGDRAVLARAGLILGPHENGGRLPYWLDLIARGGTVLAPGPPELPVRFVDVRDLAAWILAAPPGPTNLVNPAGHTSMRSLLEAAIAVTGADADLDWKTPEEITAAGIDRWAELPCWIPPEPHLAGLIHTDTTRAQATGLRCRPVEETVADTWTWLSR
ncbi:NAD-dependent epimerase/dehydratase family protein [Nonomuraea longicatena]|uniref:SDR family oxidoreductase n=1 Tax=Nonomuraea longicatena TaxID=83682 RepID=A0ABN1NUN3_9ACTN